LKSESGHPIPASPRVGPAGGRLRPYRGRAHGRTSEGLTVKRRSWTTRSTDWYPAAPDRRRQLGFKPCGSFRLQRIGLDGEPGVAGGILVLLRKPTQSFGDSGRGRGRVLGAESP